MRVDAGSPTANLPNEANDHLVCNLEQLFENDRIWRPSTDCWSPSNQALMAARPVEGPGLRPRRVRYEFGVGVVQVKERGILGPVPGVEPPAHDLKAVVGGDLHVLLRHRPPSIPRRTPRRAARYGLVQSVPCAWKPQGLLLTSWKAETWIVATLRGPGSAPVPRLTVLLAENWSGLLDEDRHDRTARRRTDNAPHAPARGDEVRPEIDRTAGRVDPDDNCSRSEALRLELAEAGDDKQCLGTAPGVNTIRLLSSWPRPATKVPGATSALVNDPSTTSTPRKRGRRRC